MMFVILAYDVQVKRSSRVRKIVKKYLHPRQKSVYEGFLTEGKLTQLKKELAGAILPEKDAVLIYKLESVGFLKVDELGTSHHREQQFL
jgi:CRISPR-associated protein Cas2